MSIKFVCSCGKHLRARDGMASRRIVCPRCGQPVGVPSGPGAIAAPRPPAECERRVAGQETDARDPVGALTLALLHSLRSPAGRRAAAAETRWYDFLRHPLREMPLWAGPAALLTVVSAVGLLLGPEMVAKGADGGAARCAPWLAGFLTLFVAGYPCLLLRHVLRAAASGDGAGVRWPGFGVGPALGSALVWLVCFMAGPVVFATLAAIYWLQCGDPGWVDWLIVAELGLLTVGYDLLVLAAVSERGRLRDANPLHVIDLAHRLGWRAAASAFAGFVLVVAHGLLAVVAAEQIHNIAALGLLLLAVCWASTLYWATVLFRLLGVWCHRSRGASRQSIVSNRHVRETMLR